MQKAIDCAVLLFRVTMISTPGGFVIFELVCVFVSFYKWNCHMSCNHELGDVD